MLYRFIFKNFKSFKELNEFSMIPEDNNRHASFIDSDIPVLRDTVIYGANASGKSNLIKAIKFFQEIIEKPEVLSKANKNMFRLDKESINSPSLFLIEIRLEDTLYQYAILVNLKDGILMAESLKEYINDQWVSIFYREYDETKNCNTIEMSYDINSENASRYEIYLKDMKRNTRKTLLAELAGKELAGDHFIDSINKIYSWFTELIILFPNTKYNLLGAIANDLESVNKLYKKYFEIFGIDIEDIKFKEVEQEYINIPDTLFDEILADLTKEKSQSKIAMLHGNTQDYLVTRSQEDGGLKFLEVSFVHRYKAHDILLSINEESEGTQRLFDLIPMLGYIISSNRVALIDEIDRSLHSLLTREILRYFINHTQEKNSQLICTTHQVLLMDLNILGRKEIWFVEKKNKVSKIYPLDQYNFDGESINMVDNYLIGRFGAIPKY